VNRTTLAQQSKTSTFFPPNQDILQRKCACGSHTAAGGECEECAKKKAGLQRKLAIGASNDPLEQEADRVADQVLSMPFHSTVNDAPIRIQRFTGQASESSDAAPPSVDRALASSGRPLEPGLRQDMEQRFGHDFSQVRVHSGEAAEQSARDVNAHAYTAGHNVVFGANRFAPKSLEGRKLIAHELTHTVQQGYSPLKAIHKTAFWNESSKINKKQNNLFAAGGIRPNVVQETAPPHIQFQNDREALNVRLKQVQDRLAKLRQQYTQLSDEFADSLSKARQSETLQKGTENLQKQARSESTANTLWGGRFARDRILKSVRVAQSGGTATVSADFELSYLVLSDEKGREKATIDIPRIEAAIRDVWQVDITSGDYAGISFRFQPKVTYLPKTSKHSESTFHIQVRGPDKEPSSGDSVSGVISLAPAHLEGARVIVVAHELAHLFGFTDTYITMVTRDKSGKEREQWGVGRVNPASRADLLGMIDPDKLARLEKQGAVLPSEVKRQTGAVRVWEEEANIVLRVLGAAPLPPERPSPDSENFDPADELEKQKREGEGKLAKIREKRGRIDNTMKSLEIAEEIIQLEKEEASLKARLSSNP